jgi:hypothetical protein
VSHTAGAHLESFVRMQSRIQMSQEVGVSCTSLVVTGKMVSNSTTPSRSVC